MRNNSPHYGKINCTCRYCSGNRTSHQNSNDTKLRRILKQKFSHTIPNAKCPICKEQVFYYENIFGSKVYFDKLGKPWPKHRHFGSTSNSKLPEINDYEDKLKIEYGENYFPITPIFKKELLKGYNIFELSNEKIKTNKFVIQKGHLGISFLEINDDEISINGFDYRGEYSLKCIPLEDAKIIMPDIFPYVIGEPLLIEIKKEHDHGIRTEIFIDRKLSVKETIGPRAFIFNASLSKNTKEELNKNGIVKIKATSKRNSSNEIIFTELKQTAYNSTYPKGGHSSSNEY